MNWTSPINTSSLIDKLRNAQPADLPNILSHSPLEKINWVGVAKWAARHNPSVLVEATKKSGVRIPSEDLEGILTSLAFSIADDPNHAQFFADFVDIAASLFNSKNTRFAVCLAADIAPTVLPRILLSLCKRDEVSWMTAADDVATRGGDTLNILIKTYQETGLTS